MSPLTVGNEPPKIAGILRKEIKHKSSNPNIMPKMITINPQIRTVLVLLFIIALPIIITKLPISMKLKIGNQSQKPKS